MQLLAAAPSRSDQVRRLEHVEVLRDALARHIQMLAQLVKRAAVMRVQHIQQLAPARIGQSLEQQISVAHRSSDRQVFACLYMQVNACLSSPPEAHTYFRLSSRKFEFDVGIVATLR